MYICTGVFLCHTNKENNVSVEVDAKLNAIYDFLPSPARNSVVGDEGHDGNSKKPDKREGKFIVSI